MKTLFVACVLALCCGVLASKKSDEGKVTIVVYYESLCPHSMTFIKDQLAPVWRDFGGAVKVEMVPYGISTHDKVNGKWQFDCHHGPDECYGNKVQACILKDKGLQDTEKMELVICLMSQSNPDKSLDTCLPKVSKQGESEKLKQCASGDQGSSLLASYGDQTNAVLRPLTFVPTLVINECLPKVSKQGESEKLKQCASGDQGSSLLASYGDQTNAVLRPLTFVPTLVINEKFDQAIQDEALKDLKKVVCSVATTKPSVC